MTVAAVVLAALLAIALVLFVARPLLAQRTGAAGAAGAEDERDLERALRLEERDRALSALKELEFDHRTGKISDRDYQELVGPLRQEAAEALRALDALTADSGEGGAPNTAERAGTAGEDAGRAGR